MSPREQIRDLIQAQARAELDRLAQAREEAAGILQSISRNVSARDDLPAVPSKHTLTVTQQQQQGGTRSAADSDAATSVLAALFAK